MRGNFNNTLPLAFFILRRERVISVIWLMLLVAVIAGLAGPMGEMMDPASRAALGATMENPAMIAMMGPVYGIKNYTVGAMYSNSMLLFSAMAVAVMNIFLVVRHTRTDEEMGRYEVLRSMPIGRMANLNAVMFFVLDINIILSVLIGLGLYVFGDYSMGLGGSMLFGAAMGTTGLVFASITALLAQLFSTSRAAAGCSFLTMGIFYILRAAGDINAEWLSLISPLGLVLRAQVYVENYIWPIVILLAASGIITIIAFKLNSLRDIEQGFITSAPGRSEAKKSLISPLGLSKRLVGGTVVVWVAVMLILGASYGSILGDIDDFVATNEFYQMLLGSMEEFSVTVLFAAMQNSMMASIGLLPIIAIILRIRTEEKEYRTEVILSATVKRIAYFGGFAAIAFAAGLFMQLANAFGLYFAAIAVLNDASELPLTMVLQANLVYLPAIWAVMALAIFLVGALPKYVQIIWVYFGFVFFMVFMGRIPDILPAWISYLSPFHYIPELPIDSVNYFYLIILISIFLIFIGFLFYNKRDITPNP